MMKKCSEDKILNPKTNRCVKKNGNIGKKLSKVENNFLSNSEEIKKNLKECSEDKILNPKTNRCVKKIGNIGKKLSKENILNTKIINKKMNSLSSKTILNKTLIKPLTMSELIKDLPLNIKEIKNIKSVFGPNIVLVTREVLDNIKPGMIFLAFLRDIEEIDELQTKKERIKFIEKIRFDGWAGPNHNEFYEDEYILTNIQESYMPFPGKIEFNELTVGGGSDSVYIFVKNAK